MRWKLVAVVLLLGIAACAGGDKARRAGESTSRQASEELVPMRVVRSLITTSVSTTVTGPPQVAPAVGRLSPAERRAVGVIELANVIGEHAMRFRWYDPEGQLYLDSGAIAVRPAGEYHRQALVWHPINIAGERASALPGTWKLAITLDDAPVGTLSFELEPAR